MCRIAAGFIAAFASGLARRMGWGPLPWQRGSGFGENAENKATYRSAGKASLGAVLLSRLRFWERGKSCWGIPSGWSLVVDRDNSVLQEWFFLLYHARTGTRIEVAGLATPICDTSSTNPDRMPLLNLDGTRHMPDQERYIRTVCDGLVPSIIPGAIGQCWRRAGADWAWRTDQESVAGRRRLRAFLTAHW